MQSKAVGIWIRVSTEDQAQGDSPEHHERRARLYAEAKGWSVAEVYRLEAVSGKAVMEHPEAKRMLADVKRGRIAGLIFSKLARLARNTRELLDFADYFRTHEADLVSLGESIDTSSPAGRLFYTMIAAMAQWEREEIASRVAASVPVRAKLGKPLGGQSPYGYLWKNGQFVVEPAEAPIRKLIYELFLKHRRKKTVARILNDQGYRTRGGAMWTNTTIERLLRDPTAKGVRISNYTKNVGKSKPIELKPESDWVYHECERIVPDELWDEVNAILDARRATGKRPLKRAVHLFAGKAFCQCGGKLYVHTSNKARYVCQACRNKIPIVDLEGIVHEQLRAYAVSPDEIAKHLDAGRDLVRQKEELIAVLEAERNKITKQQNTLIDLYQGGGLPKEDFGPRYQPLADRLKQIDEELPALEASRDVLKINSLSAEEVMAAATDLYTRWPTLSREEQRQIVEMIIDRITVGKDEVSIALLLSDNSPQMASFGERTIRGSSPPRAGSARDR
ncbi:MAG: recombinase family protein [Rhodospirillales bacterium]|nr:recombinase family protein [Rhodospirillales bacterium]